MIEDPPLLTIARTMRRPAPDVVEQFKDVPTSFVVDAMDGKGAMDWRIKPVVPHRSVTGVALTCHCGPADNLALAAAVAQCMPGDILIAATDGFTGCSVVGDLLLGIARNRGATGFVTDGLVRDVSDIEALGLACFASGISPNSPARNGPGTVRMPVQCGGLAVNSGDIVIADRDGVVIVPQDRIDGVLDRLKAVREAEAQFLAKVKAGLIEVGFISDLLAGDRVRYVP